MSSDEFELNQFWIESVNFEQLVNSSQNFNSKSLDFRGSMLSTRNQSIFRVEKFLENAANRVENELSNRKLLDCDMSVL